MKMKDVFKGYRAFGPQIKDDGIYVPINVTAICSKETAPTYSCLISKKMFIEAYNKWIKDSEVQK